MDHAIQRPGAHLCSKGVAGPSTLPTTMWLSALMGKEINCVLAQMHLLEECGIGAFYRLQINDIRVKGWLSEPPFL